MANLLSPPQLLLEALNAVTDEHAEVGTLADLIERDPGLTSRFMEVGNSVRFGTANTRFNIRQILMRLGFAAAKSLVLTAILQQFFDNFVADERFLRRFWWRSLAIGITAKSLAEITGYENPDEAYLAGLLTEAGQFLLLRRFSADYLEIWNSATGDRDLVAAERSRFGVDHCAVGADLLDSWRLPSFLSDAIRHHAAPAERLLESQHLTKLLNVAAQLEPHAQPTERALADAHLLFGLTEDLLDSIATKSAEKAKDIASALGMDSSDTALEESRQKLRSRLGELIQALPATDAYDEPENRAGLEASIRRSVFALLGLDVAMIFYIDKPGTLLQGFLDCQDESGAVASITIRAERKCSFVADALLNHQCLLVSDPESATDQQILRISGSTRVIVVPLFSRLEPAGVLVLSPKPETSLLHLESSLAFQTLRVIIGRAMKAFGEQLNTASRGAPSNTAGESDIDQAVREASNPLSVILTYLEVLKSRHHRESSESRELRLIQQEIERVCDILLRLRAPQSDHAPETRVDLARSIRSVVDVFQSTLCLSRKINLVLELPDRVPETRVEPAVVKQIVVNLIKNAIEALESGNEVKISVQSTQLAGSKPYCELIVSDNGPGMRDEVLRNLHVPVHSAWRNGRASMGLSIVKKLIDDVDGMMHCLSGTSGTSGTQFQILLPM